MRIKEMRSKELLNMLPKHVRETSPVLRVHYKVIHGAILEDCGILRAKEIKKTFKVFSIRYNRKNIIKLALKSIKTTVV